MLPPHRFDAQPPASRARRAPEHRACCWLLVVRDNRFARPRRRPAPPAGRVFSPGSDALDRERDTHPAADAQRRQPALRIALG
ncbi:hypothetical protein, partial [Burkholderia sp. GbtcB21]|uniref:hypothetical protein n=1 Tax=Burkholderia sp. GbtcB21 TaxID=2824766 RepID=UPI0020C6D1A2